MIIIRTNVPMSESPTVSTSHLLVIRVFCCPASDGLQPARQNEQTWLPQRTRRNIERFQDAGLEKLRESNGEDRFDGPERYNCVFDQIILRKDS
jgi:hypothetical protein